MAAPRRAAGSERGSVAQRQLLVPLQELLVSDLAQLKAIRNTERRVTAT